VDEHEEEVLEERARAGEIQEVRRWLRAAEERESELAAEYDEQYSELREARTEVRSLRGRLAAAGFEDLPEPRAVERDQSSDHQ
jgi:hypothetical protein